MKKPSGEVFSSLGKYVYGYKNPAGTWDYFGKGVDDRLWHHVTDKGLDPENAFIFARNLEVFDERKDASQFSVESILINLLNPKLNKVSGHKKELFEMAKFSDYVKDYQDAQYDNFSQLPEWYMVNYDSFSGRLREVKIGSSNTFLHSSVNNGVYLQVYVPVVESEFEATFEVAGDPSKDDSVLQKKQGLQKWLTEEGYKTRDVNNSKKVTIKVSSVSELLQLWNDFWS
jgi:hypothetical protein